MPTRGPKCYSTIPREFLDASFVHLFPSKPKGSQEEKALFFGGFFRHLPPSLTPWKGKSLPPSLPPSLGAHYAHRLPLFRTRLLASFSFSPPSLCAVIYWLTVDFPPPPPMFSPVSKFGIWHLLPRAQGLFFLHCFRIVSLFPPYPN